MDNENIYYRPLLGDAFPNFKAITNQGNISFLQDYKVRWVKLFCHTRNFFSAFTTKFITIIGKVNWQVEEDNIIHLSNKCQNAKEPLST